VSIVSVLKVTMFKISFVLFLLLLIPLWLFFLSMNNSLIKTGLHFPDANAFAHSSTEQPIHGTDVEDVLNSALFFFVI